ncbi:MAG: hypothetical protein AB4368_32400 [Xenococcaceae cyanobacterium]
MKFNRVTLGLLSLMSFLGVFAVTRSASAQCVQADVSVQYNISGSRQPAEQSNDVDFDSNGRCRGNASITTGVQGNEGGTGRVIQRRVVRHRFTGDNDDRSDGSTIQIQSNPTIDVYNAADRLDN